MSRFPPGGRSPTPSIPFRCSQPARPGPSGWPVASLAVLLRGSMSGQGIRKSTTSRDKKPSPKNRRGDSSAEPSFEPESITRYRVALVREEATPYEGPDRCGDPEAAARFVHQILATWDREVMGAIYLDIRNRAIGYQLAYVGTLSRAAVEPRGIL
jgi:hypothetical protein